MQGILQAIDGEEVLWKVTSDAEASLEYVQIDYAIIRGRRAFGFFSSKVLSYLKSNA